MPAGGARPGAGRPRGPSRATRERAIVAEREVVDARRDGRKLAKEVMQEFLPILAGMSAYYQPTFPGMPAQNPNGDDVEFERWLRLTIELAGTLAKYESPTFKAIMPFTPPPLVQATRPGDGAKLINPNDSVAVARAYRSVMLAPRPK